MSSAKFGSWRDWAAMARLPNVPTVWSNVLAAWILAGGRFVNEWQVGHVVFAVAGGTLLYTGGTILCDAVDAPSDRIHRPERAIPAGQVPRWLAYGVAAVLLALGSAAFFLMDRYLATVLLCCILAYTYSHTQFPASGIFLMGLCRLWLAITVGGMAAEHFGRTLLAPPWFCLWVVALFLFVCTISWLAMQENVSWRRRGVVAMLSALPLLDGTFLVFAGLGKYAAIMLGCFLLAFGLRRVAPST